MEKLLESILSAPLANLLVVTGIVFLFVAVLGTVAGKIDPGKGGRIAAGVIGGILLVIGLSMHIHLVGEQGKPTEQRERELAGQREAEQRDRELAAKRSAERRKRELAAKRDPCGSIKVSNGAGCRDFYTERRSWDSDKISRCGRYQINRYKEALNIRSQSEWSRFLSPCKKR